MDTTLERGKGRKEMKWFDRFTAWIEKHLVPIATKLQSEKHLKAIRDAFLITLPITLIGGISLIIAEPPMDYKMMEASNFFYGFFKLWAEGASIWGGPLNWLFDMTMGSLSLYIAIALSYYLSKEYKMEPFAPMMATIITVLITCTSKVEGGISLTYLSGTGLFAVMVVTMITVECFRFLHQRKVGAIKMPDSVPPALIASFAALAPVMIIGFVTLLVNTLLVSYTGLSLPECSLEMVKPIIATVDNIFGVMFTEGLQQILWFFGIHDTAIGSVLEPIRIHNIAVNASNYATGVADRYIYTQPFHFMFVCMGGSGATLGLGFYLLKCKSKQLKTIGKLGVIPSLFNINEPIIFGMPIMMNPIMLIPFVFVGIFNSVLTYIVMAIGLVNIPVIDPSWNMFSPIGAVLSTLDMRSLVLIAALIILDILIYLPFVKVYDKKLVEQELIEEKEKEEDPVW